jgi:hypothetical protein
MFSFLRRLFGKKQKDLQAKQYEQIGRLIVHGAMTDRRFNRAISALPLYPKLLEIIGQHPEQRKARMFVNFFQLYRKR